MSIIKIGVEGIIVLPIAIRDRLSLNCEDELQLDCLQDDILILKKVNSKTRFERWLKD
jgi:bifunctional DNA-binding transcriptional regulator/antitoxin component of YhaV-PrlF toxin-antitoxin module